MITGRVNWKTLRNVLENKSDLRITFKTKQDIYSAIEILMASIKDSINDNTSISKNITTD